MLNKAMIIGRLGAKPELKYTTSGDPATTLNVATTEVYYDRERNKQERTEWHRVSLFGKVAEHCANYLDKGSLVYVEGSIQTRKWQDKNGQDRYTTEINGRTVQFLDRRGDSQNQAPRDNQQQSYGGYEDSGSPFPGQANMGNNSSQLDDMPF